LAIYDFDSEGLVDYPNVPPTIGMAISHDKALSGPLNTVLGLEALYDILEIILVDAHNQRVIAKRTKK
jgi:hypothetical protein